MAGRDSDYDSDHDNDYAGDNASETSGSSEARDSGPGNRVKRWIGLWRITMQHTTSVRRLSDEVVGG